jgi:hypothetical protein
MKNKKYTPFSVMVVHVTCNNTKYKIAIQPTYYIALSRNLTLS